MRTLTLAQSLRERGCEVSFVARRHAGNHIATVQGQGFKVVGLPAPQLAIPLPPALPHADWVGATQERDARETTAAIRELGARPDWLIVDHYGLDERWEAHLRSSVQRIFVIDDLADRRHDCDLLLDQNLVEGFETRYLGKLREECPCMLGPRYALLQPDYGRLHDQVQPRAGSIRRLFIYFGSADRPELTELALHAVVDLGGSNIEADAVVSGEAPAAEAVRTRFARHPNVRVHGPLPSLAPLMASADLAIGAAGSNSWERMCLGLPAVVITLAENQRAVARALDKRGFIRWLGDADKVGLAELQSALAERIKRGSDEASARASYAVVDGRGVKRVGAALRVSASMRLAVRRAAAADEALLLEWANDPVTRRNSFARHQIGAAEHHQWLAGRLHAQDRCLLLIVDSDDGVPLGMVRFDRTGRDWTLNYSIAAPYRGRGLARPTLECALLQLGASDARGVRARVMQANAASHRVFRRLGFEVVSEAGGAVEYRRAL